MVVHFIAHSNLDVLLDRLRRYGDVHGPVRCDDGVVRFAELSSGALPDFSANRTLIPPKKYLLHPSETILTYSVGSGYQVPVEGNSALILFGLHPCDLAGINYLDQIFLSDCQDPMYAARRYAMTLVGISCTPDKFCSCHRFKSPLKAFYDLFLQVVDGGYTVVSGSSRGDGLLDTIEDLFEECTSKLPVDTRSFFDQAISRRVLSEPDAARPEWQELSGHCLGCGACSVCCPTCYCFDVLEFSGLDGRSAERIRSWDNCLLKKHAQVAGGENFEKSRAGRFCYRYRHKYQGFGTFQIQSCVGCGRCRSACPAGLDLRPLAELLERAEL